MTKKEKQELDAKIDQLRKTIERKNTEIRVLHEALSDNTTTILKLRSDFARVEYGRWRSIQENAKLVKENKLLKEENLSIKI